MYIYTVSNRDNSIIKHTKYSLAISDLSSDCFANESSSCFSAVTALSASATWLSRVSISETLEASTS